MILGIGIDAVEIKRFNHWQNYPHSRLARIFSAEEISYCLQEPTKSAERFAIRFAAKEALFKALCQAYPHSTLTLLTLARNACLTKTNNIPTFNVDFRTLNMESCSVLVSLTHTQTTAYAQAIVQKLIIKH